MQFPSAWRHLFNKYFHILFCFSLIGGVQVFFQWLYISVGVFGLDFLSEYSETLGLGVDQFYGFGLSLEAETQIISVSDTASILRLCLIQSRSWNWDLENYSLGLSLKFETQKISVADLASKLRQRKYQSRSQSRKSKLSLADHWYPSPVQAGLAWLYSQLFQPPTQSQPNGESYISAVAN